MYLQLVGAEETKKQQREVHGPSLQANGLQASQSASLSLSFHRRRRRRRRRRWKTEDGILARPSLVPSSLTLLAKTIPEAETIFSIAYAADRALLVEPTAMVVEVFFYLIGGKKQKLDYECRRMPFALLEALCFKAVSLRVLCASTQASN